MILSAVHATWSAARRISRTVATRGEPATTGEGHASLREMPAPAEADVRTSHGDDGCVIGGEGGVRRDARGAVDGVGGAADAAGGDARGALDGVDGACDARDDVDVPGCGDDAALLSALAKCERKAPTVGHFADKAEPVLQEKDTLFCACARCFKLSRIKRSFGSRA